MNGIYDSLRGAISRRRAYNRTLAELDSLSPRELDDLGLAHSDIRRVARQSVYGG